MIPRRVQRKRTKGWKLPRNTVCVSRPGIFGNPFGILHGQDREYVVRIFRQWLTKRRSSDPVP